MYIDNCRLSNWWPTLVRPYSKKFTWIRCSSIGSTVTFYTASNNYEHYQSRRIRWLGTLNLRGHRGFPSIESSRFSCNIHQTVSWFKNWASMYNHNQNHSSSEETLIQVPYVTSSLYIGTFDKSHKHGQENIWNINECNVWFWLSDSFSPHGMQTILILPYV